ncbi:phage portal protein [Bacillus infantis]|uniref:phage portal protein n=1 Tax=Bacillus infantis TaxID=324767 RepID=UPI0013E9B7D1|nr:phage portal protein [Bacillus infantis]
MFRINKEDLAEITSDKLKVLLENHDTTREDGLYKYYIGEHKILDRKFKDESKPNNKIVENWCKYVSNSAVSFFMGKPVVYSSDNEKYMQEIQDIYDANNEQKVNMEIAQELSWAGWAVEILYTKENEKGVKVPCFASLPLSENKVILVFDNTVEENLIMAIRYWDSENLFTRDKYQIVFVHTDSHIYGYKKTDNSLELISEEKHAFKEVNINYYWNKGRKLESDFDQIMSLNDGYNSLVSDDVNESEFSTDAILKTWGVEDLNDAQEMKEKRMLNFGKSDKEEKADAEWLIKDINSEWKENQKNRMMDDIHKLSNVPNMSDKSFAESSGVAIERRMLPMESVRSTKERYFREGLQRRLRMITNVLNLGNNYDYLDIIMKFQRNLPTDTQLAVQDAVNLNGTGLVSKQTLRKTIPFIDDPAYEKVLIDQENEEYIDLNIEDEDDGTESNNEENPEANQANGETDK